MMIIGDYRIEYLGDEIWISKLSGEGMGISPERFEDFIDSFYKKEF